MLLENIDTYFALYVLTYIQYKLLCAGAVYIIFIILCNKIVSYMKMVLFTYTLSLLFILFKAHLNKKIFFLHFSMGSPIHHVSCLILNRKNIIYCDLFGNNYFIITYVQIVIIIKRQSSFNFNRNYNFETKSKFVQLYSKDVKQL